MMMAPAMSAARKLGAAAKLQMSSEQSRNTSTTSNLLCWREMLEDATLSAYFRVLGFETTDAAPLLHSVAINPSFRVCQLCTYNMPRNQGLAVQIAGCGRLGQC